MASEQLGRLLERLEAAECRPRRESGRHMALCPAHDDRIPSLSIREGDDGRILILCFAGCETKAILSAAQLEWSDLFAEDTRSFRERRAPTIIATYPYADENGDLLFEVVRQEPKAFRQRRPDGKGGWLWNLDGVRRVPFRLPRLLEAVAAQEHVFIVEGEKDVVLLESLGLAATCNPGGAGKWRPDYSKCLRGARVAIIPDNDEAGRSHAQYVAESLAGVAESVRVLDLPGLSPSGDVSDWLSVGGTAEQLLSLALEANDSERDQPVDEEIGSLASLLAEVERFLRRYVAFSSQAQTVAVVLWVAHTWAIGAAEVSPYLAITSPEKKSGKSRLLEVLAFLVPKPWKVIEPSNAALFRKIEEVEPTLLLDEADAIFRVRSENFEALRGLLNAGNRRGTKVVRCRDRGRGIDEFEVFCPKAIAGIGRLPDTVADRSISIALTRKKPGEVVARFREREVKAEAATIPSTIKERIEPLIDRLKEARPPIPELLDDRAADGWEPLLAIADEAGGEWPKRARDASLFLHAGAIEEESLGVRLLVDIEGVFRERGVDKMTSANLAQALVEIEEAPWGDLRGRELDARGLARRLRAFGIRPKKIRIGDQTLQGYGNEEFVDAWDRYVPSIRRSVRNTGTEQVETSIHPEHEERLFRNKPEQDDEGVPDVPEHPVDLFRRNQASEQECSGVPVEKSGEAKQNIEETALAAIRSAFGEVEVLSVRERKPGPRGDGIRG